MFMINYNISNTLLDQSQSQQPFLSTLLLSLSKTEFCFYKFSCKFYINSIFVYNILSVILINIWLKSFNLALVSKNGISYFLETSNPSS